MLLGLWNCDSKLGDLGGSGGGTSALPGALLKAGEGGKESLLEVRGCAWGGGGGGGGGVGGRQSLPSAGAGAAAGKSVVLLGNPQGGTKGRGGGGGGGGGACEAPA